MEVRASATGFLAGVIMWSLKREMCFLRRDGECELCKLIALFVAAAGITVLCVCVCVCVWVCSRPPCSGSSRFQNLIWLLLNTFWMGSPFPNEFMHVGFGSKYVDLRHSGCVSPGLDYWSRRGRLNLHKTPSRALFTFCFAWVCLTCVLVSFWNYWMCWSTSGVDRSSPLGSIFSIFQLWVRHWLWHSIVSHNTISNSKHFTNDSL